VSAVSVPKNATAFRKVEKFDGGSWLMAEPDCWLMGTVGDTRIVALEVKLEDRRNTTLSESRCQVRLC